MVNDILGLLWILPPLLPPLFIRCFFIAVGTYCYVRYVSQLPYLTLHMLLLFMVLLANEIIWSDVFLKYVILYYSL